MNEYWWKYPGVCYVAWHVCVILTVMLVVQYVSDLIYLCIYIWFYHIIPIVQQVYMTKLSIPVLVFHHHISFSTTGCWSYSKWRSKGTRCKYPGNCLMHKQIASIASRNLISSGFNEWAALDTWARLLLLLEISQPYPVGVWSRVTIAHLSPGIVYLAVKNTWFDPYCHFLAICMDY